MSNSPVRQTLKCTTGDFVLDCLAASLAHAFLRADRGDEQCKDDLLNIFGLGRMALLYRDGLIRWNPRLFVFGEE